MWWAWPWVSDAATHSSQSVAATSCRPSSLAGELNQTDATLRCIGARAVQTWSLRGRIDRQVEKSRLRSEKPPVRNDEKSQTHRLIETNLCSIQGWRTGFSAFSDTSGECYLVISFLAPTVYSISDGLNIDKRIKHIWKGHGADSEIGNVSARHAARQPLDKKKRFLEGQSSPQLISSTRFRLTSHSSDSTQFTSSPHQTPSDFATSFLTLLPFI